MEVSIELQNGDFLAARDLNPQESPYEFIKSVQADGGIFMPVSNGTHPFFPYASIASFWFHEAETAK